MEDVFLGVKTLLLDGEVSHLRKTEIMCDPNPDVVAFQVSVPAHFHLDRCEWNNRHLEDHCKYLLDDPLENP